MAHRHTGTPAMRLGILGCDQTALAFPREFDSTFGIGRLHGGNVALLADESMQPKSEDVAAARPAPWRDAC